MENTNTNTPKTPSSSSKLRSKILKILPKAAAAVTMTFQNPPFSPGRDHHLNKPRSDHTFNSTPSSLKPHPNKGFSAPIMIPDEARRNHRDASGIEAQEPTSPKVSCIGQIKHKKKKKQSKTQNPQKSTPLPVVVVASTPKDEDAAKTEEKKMMKKQGSKRFQRMLVFNTGKPKTGVRKSSASSTVIGGEGKINDGDSDNNNAPPIGYMRRFASGRETFANFDWKAQIAPEEMNHRDFYSEDDRAENNAGEEKEEEEEEEEEEIMIPFSAPIGGRGGGGGGNGGFGGGFGGGGGNLGNLQPRKEINLWKRRTMAQPRPLQLNPVLTASK